MCELKSLIYRLVISKSVKVASRGVFKGEGHGAMPLTLGRQYSKISIEYYVKLRHGPPYVTWAESLSTKTDKI